MVELQKIATEQRNPNTMNIDTLSTLDMVKLINREDHRVADAVGEVTDKIAQAVDVIAEKLAAGGRLIYCGAGTSGRLGILDAVECPPTYSTDPETVQALMAGGYGAIFKAVEGAEDSKELGVEDMKNIHFSQKDVLVGIAASGRTPYVLGCMEYAKELGAPTVAVTCCPGSILDSFADIGIAPAPGPETDFADHSGHAAAVRGAAHQGQGAGAVQQHAVHRRGAGGDGLPAIRQRSGEEGEKERADGVAAGCGGRGCWPGHRHGAGHLPVRHDHHLRVLRGL